MDLSDFCLVVVNHSYTTLSIVRIDSNFFRQLTSHSLLVRVRIDGTRVFFGDVSTDTNASFCV